MPSLSQFKIGSQRKFIDTSLAFYCNAWLLTSYFRLRKKYNSVNSKLGQTGAGLSLDELNGNETMKPLLGQYVLFLLAYGILTMF